MKRVKLLLAGALFSVGLMGLSTGCFNRTAQGNISVKQEKTKSSDHKDATKVDSSKKSQKSSIAVSSSSQTSQSSSSESSTSVSSSISSQTSATSAVVVTPPTVSAQSGTNHIASANSYAYSAATVHTEMTGTPTTINHKVVFLTFDDGVNTSMTPRVLSVLQKYGVHATFFIVGNTINATTAPVLRQEYDSGHGIAIHSFTHQYHFNAPGNSGAALQEYQQTLAAMKNVLGANFDSKVWRYPGGHMSWRGLADSDAKLNAQGITWMDWNAAVGDALGSSGPKTAQAMLQYHAASITAFPQSNVEVVLIHDAVGKELSLAILPQIIQYYQQRQYQFGILS